MGLSRQDAARADCTRIGGIFLTRGHTVLLGSKSSLEQLIHEITGVVIAALRGGPLTTFQVEERLSWANRRETKRPEDKAYSLFGIFNNSMPLSYGEGMEKALVRLKKEIRKSSSRN
jgi:hypothetical protein